MIILEKFILVDRSISDMQLGNTPQPTPKKSGKKTVMIVVIVVIIILALIFILPPLLSSITGSSTSTSPTTQSNTLLSSGTVESLSPGYYYYVNFTLPSGSYSISLSGSYTSNNNVEVGVLTATQFGAFTQNPSSISSAGWYSGDNDGATISFTPSPGTSYSLVIYDANVFTSDTVTVVNAVTLTYTISS